MLSVKQNMHFRTGETPVPVALYDPQQFLIFRLLTYMSIRVEIKARLRRLIRERKLMVLPKLYIGDQRKRCILLSKQVADAVISPDGGMPDDDRLGYFRGDLDAFAMGEGITIASDPFAKESDAILAPVHPVSSLAWDIRVLEPPNGIRCMGFFAAKDVFIALAWDYREDIEEREDWADLVDDCRAKWDQMLYPFTPHSGEFPHAYISKPLRVV